MTTCAYPRCQAGGTILEDAPRVLGGGRNRGTIWHPGCYEAERRLNPTGEVDVSDRHPGWYDADGVWWNGLCPPAGVLAYQRRRWLRTETAR